MSCSSNGPTDQVDSLVYEESEVATDVAGTQSQGKDINYPAAPETKQVMMLAADSAPVRLKAMKYSAIAQHRSVEGAIGLPTPSYAQPNRESYNAVEENRFINAQNDSLSTFSIDVDTASYANVRRMINSGQIPPVGAIRAEEMINYFQYRYPEPQGTMPLTVATEIGPSPFHEGYQLLKIGMKARNLDREEAPPSNLVFLIDVSGSMQHPNKLPLLKQSMGLLVKQLGASDRVSIVVYAGSDFIALNPTRGDQHQTIIQALERLQPGGSTHASSGITTAYQLARQVFIPGGNNRVILASDGDFNVGVTSRGALQELVEKEREDGINLTVLGFGMGNYHDDTMEILANKGNGNYAYIDSLLEAKKVLVKEMAGTLYTLAKDVKIQVEFNPSLVGAHRLIGYENRALADEDFTDDRKDAGELGAGHRVTALYELIPADHPDIPALPELKYKKVSEVAEGGVENELATIKVRYKPRGKERSELLLKTVHNQQSGNETSDDFRFAAAVAGYSMLLRKSDHLSTFTWEDCLALIRNARGDDPEGYRAEFLQLVEKSQLLDNKG
ncbi:MAG: VWA domain-containing protein [Desulfobulbaceae bacterium]|nr:MAG: VWA domain-containing protein [Desulfobulbaceae bacterium]